MHHTLVTGGYQVHKLTGNCKPQIEGCNDDFCDYLVCNYVEDLWLIIAEVYEQQKFMNSEIMHYDVCYILQLDWSMLLLFISSSQYTTAFVLGFCPQIWG